MENKSINKLKAGLSMREDNLHNEAHMGGNPSQYLFLMNHTCLVEPSETLSFTEQDNTLKIKMPENVSQKDLRDELDRCYNASSNKQNITFAEIGDVDFLKKLDSKTNDVLMLIECMEHAYRLKASLAGKSNNKLSDDDVSVVKAMQLLPVYVKLPAFRLIIKIENVVKFDIDEYLTIKMD